MSAPLVAGIDLSTRRHDVAIVPLEADHGDEADALLVALAGRALCAGAVA